MYFKINSNTDVSNHFFYLKDLKQLNDYIFVPELYKKNKNESAKKFDLIDIVIIYGKCNYLPWE